MTNPDDILSKLGAARSYTGLEQLICAALADTQFTRWLLSDPASAVQHPPPPVQLSPEERALASSVVGAVDIHDFAAQLHQKAQQHSSSS
jgi:hypothetical protein